MEGYRNEDVDGNVLEVDDGDEFDDEQDLSDAESQDEINDLPEEDLQPEDALLLKRRKTQRLYLQLVLSGGIVVGGGLLLIFFRLIVGIVSLFTGRAGIVGAMTELGSTLHFYLSALRLSGEILIVVGLFFATIHRIIGFALSYYLQTTLDPDGIGQYQFNFDWISLRCGLDQNQLVISGLEWRNPAVFTNTPYLLRIDEISFTLDPWSVYGAVMHDTAIKIREIKLDKASIHIEKLSQRSIDRAAAAALAQKMQWGTADTTTDTTATDAAAATAAAAEAGPVPDADAQTERDSDSESDSDGNSSDSDSSSTAERREQKQQQRLAKKIHEPLRPGVLNLWAAMGACNPEQEASTLSRISQHISSTMGVTANMVQILGSVAGRLDVGKTLMRGAQSVTNTIGRGLRQAFSTRASSNSGSKPKRSGTGSDAGDRSRAGTMDGIAEDGDGISPLRDAQLAEESCHAELTLEETMAMLQAEYPDLVLPPKPEDAYDEDDVRHLAEAQKDKTPKSKRRAERRAARKKREAEAAEAARGFGIPFKLEIDFLLLHDVKLHAQDFLASNHRQQSKACAIKLGTLGMMRKDLTLPPDRKLGGHRRGIYLDDVVWRLVNRLLSDLLRQNSIAMMRLLSSAAASHTTSAVSSAGSLASRGATSGGRMLSQAASSTTQSAHKALNSMVHSVFSPSSSNSSNRSNASAPPVMTSPATEDSPARSPARSRGASNATAGMNNASAAAHSAVQALNSTTADAARGARSALNSVGQFMKRGSSTGSKTN